MGEGEEDKRSQVTTSLPRMYSVVLLFPSLSFQSGSSIPARKEERSPSAPIPIMADGGMRLFSLFFD